MTYLFVIEKITIIITFLFEIIKINYVPTLELGNIPLSL